MILAIESASTDPSVALARDDGSSLAQDAWSAGGGQGRELMPRILALLTAQGLDLGGVRAVAVGLGPGSFTGLRVGMSLAKGLAIGLGIRVVGIGSLEAWLASEPLAPAALSRAGAREAYLMERGTSEVRVIDRDALPPEARRARVVAPRELAAAFGLAGAVPPAAAAQAMARMAVERLRASPDGDPPAALEPRYVRAPRGVANPVAEVVTWP